MLNQPLPTTRSISGIERTAWRTIQLVVWLVAAGIVLALLFWPDIGLHAFWNVLIPVAPALLVVSPGVWRNICPLGSTAMLSRHMSISRRLHVGDRALSVIGFVGVVLLLLLVPLRHLLLDLSGPSTAFLLCVLGGAAFLMGFLFDSKSAWCSGACPVFPVEQLYGRFPLYSPANAHCGMCSRCVTRCAESSPSTAPHPSNRSSLSKLCEVVLTGGFVGYIWGWFKVADYRFEVWNAAAAAKVFESYAWPFGAMLAALVVYLLLKKRIGPDPDRRLDRTFAAAAVACYYWYRLPALFGFGLYPEDGMLVDLTGSLPAWSVAASRLATTAIFAFLLLGRKEKARSWTTRPPMLESQAANQKT